MWYNKHRYNKDFYEKLGITKRYNNIFQKTPGISKNGITNVFEILPGITKNFKKMVKKVYKKKKTIGFTFTFPDSKNTNLRF